MYDFEASDITTLALEMERPGSEYLDGLMIDV